MSPTATKKKAAPPKKAEAPAKKAPPKKKAPDYDAARAALADKANPHAGGDVNAPNMVAYNALNLFDKHRYSGAFHAIAEALVETAA